MFPDGTPLWFGILREAELTSGGAELGPVGGGIVAEVFVDAAPSGQQQVDQPEEADLPDVSGGDFRIGDLLVAADQPREKNLSHRLSNRAAAEEFARFSTLLTRDRGGTASTNNFTGQMTLLESDPAGTASTNSFTKQMTLPLGGTASSNNFTEQMTKNAAFGRDLDPFGEPDHRGLGPCRRGCAPMNLL